MTTIQQSKSPIIDRCQPHAPPPVFTAQTEFDWEANCR